MQNSRQGIGAEETLGIGKSVTEREISISLTQVSTSLEIERNISKSQAGNCSENQNGTHF